MGRLTTPKQNEAHIMFQRFFSAVLVFIILLAVHQAGPAYGSAKYIIILISDGQGAKHIEATNNYTGSTPAYQSDPAWTLSWQATYPDGGGYDANQAWSDFNYLTSGYTDSSAAATALFCGEKTQNGRVSVSANASERFFCIGEEARNLGKAVGVISTVPISHATPGTFTSHNEDRGNAYAIADEALFEDPNTTGQPSDAKYGGGFGPTIPSADVVIGDRRSSYVSAAILDKLRAESGQPGKHVLVERQSGQDGGTLLMNAA
ncbi:MAG TPA: hypothetical protein EYP90_05660, partial [Chromatiaceae bacterium]|nr:hypothetical protein [Chromatiaceae bacterium]